MNRVFSFLTIKMTKNTPFFLPKNSNTVFYSFNIRKSFNSVILGHNYQSLNIFKSSFSKIMEPALFLETNYIYQRITEPLSQTQSTILKECIFYKIVQISGNTIYVKCSTGTLSLSDLSFIECSSGTTRGIVNMEVDVFICTRSCFISCIGECPSLYSSITQNHVFNYTSETNLTGIGISSLGAHFVGKNSISIRNNNNSFMNFPSDTINGCVWYFVHTANGLIGSYNNAIHNKLMTLIGFHLGGATSSLSRINFVNNSLRNNGAFGTNCCSTGSLSLIECVFINSTWNKKYANYESHTLIFSSCFFDFQYTLSRFSGFGTPFCIFSTITSTFSIDENSIFWCLGQEQSKRYAFIRSSYTIFLYCFVL